MDMGKVNRAIYSKGMFKYYEKDTILGQGRGGEGGG